MRRNAPHLRRPSQCELPWLEENSICDTIVPVLSGKPDVANDIAVEVHLHARWLNGSFLERLNGEHPTIEEARDGCGREHAHAGTFLPRPNDRGMVESVRLCDEL